MKRREVLDSSEKRESCLADCSQVLEESNTTFGPSHSGQA